jgi:hypothetical protein
VDRLSNLNAGQTVTIQEGKGVAGNRPYGKTATWGKIRAKKGQGL